MTETRSPLSLRRWALVCLSPSLFVVGTDVIRRASLFPRLDSIHAVGYLASVLTSMIVWSAFTVSISATRGAFRAFALALFVVLYGLSVCTQGAFFSLWHVYASVDSLIDAREILPALIGELPLRKPSVVFHLAVGAIATGVMAWRAVKTPPPGRIMPALAFGGPIIATTALCVFPASYRQYQASTPDFIYFHGQVNLIAENVRTAFGMKPRFIRVARRQPMPVPNVTPHPLEARNVLFILEESQRADVTCIAPTANCTLATPASNLAAPDRMPLLQMRSIGSSTAVAIATLWSGLPPTVRGKDWETAPLLWDYAHAAGYDTAYWTSQDLMFGNSRLFVEDLPLTHFVTGSDLDPMSDILTGAPDAALTTRVLSEWPELKEPFFAVVHYSNVHRPRLYDPAYAPFQPADTKGKRRDSPEQVNEYMDAVYLSDRAVGRLIDGVRASSAGPRTVIVYLSDHGESFFEHNQDNNHSGSVYDEEIRIPAWIDAPPGTLDDDERASLGKAAHMPTFEVDVAPTILDLLGVHDERLKPFTDKMTGRSLVSGNLPEITVPLTNVCWAWEYRAPNWGVMRGERKLEARVGDKEYHCFDLGKDPFERRDLGEAACSDLVTEAGDLFHMMPKDLGRLANNPAWGSGP